MAQLERYSYTKHKVLGSNSMWYYLLLLSVMYEYEDAGKKFINNLTQDSNKIAGNLLTLSEPIIIILHLEPVCV